MSDYTRPSVAQTNGHVLGHQASRPELSSKRTDTYNSSRSADSGLLAPARINALSRKDSSISDTGSAPDSLLDLYGTNRSGINSVDLGERKLSDIYGDEEDPEHSRWIHRDKLARIESQELQAAGIILPRARATSKSSRREHSRDQQGTGLRSEQAGQKRQRIGSLPTEEENEENHDWDLRLPEEAAEDQGDPYRDISGGVKGVSRIPVSKTSPIPIPVEHLERDTLMRRKQGGGWTGDDEPILYSKTRGRSDSIKILEDSAATPTPAKRLVSDNSPTKKAARKAPTSATRAASSQRPKTRSGSNPQAAGQRPSTRSGELGSTRRPEGDPPWLATMYKPDPRLPPDQQLLPTVAKRLQQEQWEKEGKFATAYDTSFRPLNDQEIQPQPAIAPQPTEIPEQKPEQGSEWPLRGPKSPTLSTGRPGTAGGYSTMPRITSTPHTPQGIDQVPPKPVRIQELPEEAKKDGCGCCIVM